MIIIVATIISFVAYFAPSRKYSTGEGGPTVTANFGSINGEAITPEQFGMAVQEARILLRINTGEWPNFDTKKEQLTQIARQRVLLISLLDQYHIVPTQEAAARFIKQLLGVRPTDVVSQDKINEVLTKLAHEGGVTLDDIDRFALHQAAQQYLVALVGMSGELITTNEAAVFYRRENEPMETELVTFPATNYYASITPTQKDIEDFYDKREADYRLPDRIVVNYVVFDNSNYTAAAEKDMGTNISEQVDQAYLQAGPAAFKDKSGVQLSPEAAKEKIKKEILQYAMSIEARKAANGFINDLGQGHDDQHPFSPDDLFTIAKTRHMEVHTTAPFDMKNPPEALDIPETKIHMLFSLRADDPDDKERTMLYATSPLVGENGVYIVGLKERIPSVIQPLSEVHDKVVADYRDAMAQEMSKAAGKRFQDALQDGMTQGKSFDTMCAAQFVRPRKLSPFSLMTESIPEIADKEEFHAIQYVAGKLQAGGISPFVPTAKGGFLLYVKAHLPVDVAEMNEKLPGYLARMREQLQIAAFNQWFGRQYQLHFVPPPGELPAAGG